MSEDLREVLRNELIRRFPYKERLAESDFAYEGRPLEAVAVANTLAAWLPYHRFYRTQLTTGYLEYTFVEIIAAINEQEYQDVRILMSPTFTPTSPEFFELFLGLSLSEAADRIGLTESIAEMLADLTFEGRVKAVSISNGRHIYNLYRQDVLEHQVIFDFVMKGVLTAVQVTKAPVL
jgi:hypothetical protein